MVLVVAVWAGITPAPPMPPQEQQTLAAAVEVVPLVAAAAAQEAIAQREPKVAVAVRRR